MVCEISRLKHGGYQLLVDGKPFFMRAAELQNSSLSSSVHMQDIWPKLVTGNINCALGPVSWQDIEPEEGKFVWEELDLVISDAGKYGIKLVLLWFGSFKNGESCLSFVQSNPETSLLYTTV
jgi:beta-galactosidase GanA